MVLNFTVWVGVSISSIFFLVASRVAGTQIDVASSAVFVAVFGGVISFLLVMAWVIWWETMLENKRSEMEAD
jgi:amino acid permease